jgi:hypothetical protein
MSRALSILLGSFLFTGCMSNLQEVRIHASPADATISWGGASVVGDAKVLLKRGEDVTLLCRAPGYRAQSVTLHSEARGGRLAEVIVHDVCFAPLTVGFSLFVGLPIHLSNGTARVLSPDEVTFLLEPDPLQVSAAAIPTAAPEVPMLPCPVCGEQRPTAAEVCPRCGLR